MRKVTYVLSGVEKAVAFEWIVACQKEIGAELSFIFLNRNPNSPLQKFVEERGVQNSFIQLKSKKDYPIVFLKLLKSLKEHKSDIVHCHLFDASFLGLMASRLLGIKQRIYTRHHATYHHQYFPKMVKYDQFNNHNATHVVAISSNVKKVLLEQEGIDESKVKLIEHGFDLKAFNGVSASRIEKIRDKYQIPSNKFIVGCISRYMKLKGIDYIIEAYSSFIKEEPNAHLVLANAKGPDEAWVKKELSKLPKASYTEVLFEEDLFALYQQFNVFVHCPINENIEAFGQTYVEALASGIPSVFTLSGIAKDFIENENNALVVEFKSHEGILSSLNRIKTDDALRERLIRNGKQSVKRFDLSEMVKNLTQLYLLN